ncbi:saccharopine dehydrogenase family protein [Candidatus Riflebacteria bacterium]
MKILLFGAGLMGKAIIFDMLKQNDLKVLGIFEKNKGNLEKIRRNYKDRRLKFFSGDVTDKNRVNKVMQNFDTVISAVHYNLNYDLSLLAIENGCCFCDLGGNYRIVQKQLTLDKLAREKNVCIIPDCGLAPGLSSIFCVSGIKKMEHIEEIKIRVGGLPQNPEPPLNYKLVFSIKGVINQYKEKTFCIKNWKIREINSLSGLENLFFPEPFGRLEAFNTSGGISTLPHTLSGKVRNLNFKTIRYPGHCKGIKLMRDLGFFDEDKIILKGVSVSKRETIEAILEKKLTNQDKDCSLVRVDILGKYERKNYLNRFQIIDYFDESSGLTSMMRMTGFPVSIIAQMLSRNKIRKIGVKPQEEAVPPAAFIKGLKQRKIPLEESMEEVNL